MLHRQRRGHTGGTPELSVSRHCAPRRQPPPCLPARASGAATPDLCPGGVARPASGAGADGGTKFAVRQLGGQYATIWTRAGGASAMCGGPCSKRPAHTPAVSPRHRVLGPVRRALFARFGSVDAVRALCLRPGPPPANLAPGRVSSRARPKRKFASFPTFGAPCFDLGLQPSEFMRGYSPSVSPIPR
jgi:hypothetical protein